MRKWLYIKVGDRSYIEWYCRKTRAPSTELYYQIWHRLAHDQFPASWKVLWTSPAGYAAIKRTLEGRDDAEDMANAG